MSARRTRCAAVAGVLLLGGPGAGLVLAREAVAPLGGGATVEDAVVRLCLVLLLGCTLWATASGLAAVVEAWRGCPRPAARAGLVRRVVLAACGVAVVVSCAGPAVADPSSDPSPDPLSGLPMPERATDGPAPARAAGHVVVRAGDSLWSLSADRLPRGATDAEIGADWQRTYAANRAALGPDPDLIHPGQVLDLPSTEENR